MRIRVNALKYVPIFDSKNWIDLGDLNPEQLFIDMLTEVNERIKLAIMMQMEVGAKHGL